MIGVNRFRRHSMELMPRKRKIRMLDQWKSFSTGNKE
jgi:hypothetical protein